ncbi:lysylphosphatidylglycerol synthase domain-containing protein [Nocardioides sp. Iso805N]|uniref:lysylphosphatidylglycerol synthase domain-containing protein n=1 Tax=Nocardioides sp. Iso805N TaxID=1283287 RepID=UPI000378D66D|nr:lysylphosphatidylglycerol synthase domain-containing protein [Nocardioides sp. Iso805N]
MVAAVVTVVAVRLIGQVDWGEVWDALNHLDWWQVPVLIALLLVRQTLNALPLSLYIEGVSPYRATLNDQVAILMSTIAPPPSDLAIRTAMFSSWGVSVARGMAGTVMNTLTFYIVRFSAPAAGLLLVMIKGDALGIRLIDLASIGIATTMVVVLMLVMRSEALAGTIGRRAGRVARRFRDVDPEAWAQRCIRFREDVAARFRYGFPRSLMSLSAMLLVDATMLILCLRFVGLGPADAPIVEVVAAYLIAYPLTLFPFSGLGLVDAVVLAAVCAVGGQDVEAVAVAALIVWRVFIVGGPIVLGVVAMAIWRRTAEGPTTIKSIVRSARKGTDPTGREAAP